MRNESADVLRRVAAGETILVTNSGQPSASSARPLATFTMPARHSVQRGASVAAMTPDCRGSVLQGSETALLGRVSQFTKPAMRCAAGARMM